MYRILRTSSRTLISADEVTFASPSNTNVEARFINTAIEIAEARFIKPALCTDLYNDLRKKKNVFVDAINIDFLQTFFPLTDSKGKPIEPIKVGDIVNAIELVGNQYYVNLWNEVLWKTIAECVIYIASPANYSRFTASGETENNPASPMGGQDAASVDLQTMKWKMDRMMQDRIDPMLAALNEWLYDNRGYFPLANCKDWDCNNTSTRMGNSDGIAFERKTAWITGVYPERKGCLCNRDE